MSINVGKTSESILTCGQPWPRHRCQDEE